MVSVISCQAAAIFLCVVAAYAVATPVIGKEKRDAVPQEFLAALASLSNGGVAEVRSLPAETRSVDQGTQVSGSASDCGDDSAVGQSVVDLGSNWDWSGGSEMAMSAATNAFSNSSVYFFHFLALVQMIFVLVSMV
ncbi:hypothetical protein PoB_006534100 [Plakobranchus ocellatus]|uniref:Uncharacterized protein n=1 Tax=Plakobranchus ocellatus TaxID=259542 RepID=A0AAV4D4F1_9GAST|nr:hypothetical protein PoB_006534100 [Plakobranchus ocellatus]